MHIALNRHLFEPSLLQGEVDAVWLSETGAVPADSEAATNAGRLQTQTVSRNVFCFGSCHPKIDTAITLHFYFYSFLATLLSRKSKRNPGEETKSRSQAGMFCGSVLKSLANMATSLLQDPCPIVIHGILRIQGSFVEEEHHPTARGFPPWLCDSTRYS